MDKILALLIALMTVTTGVTGCNTDDNATDGNTIQVVQSDNDESKLSDKDEGENDMIGINIKISNEIFEAKLYDNKITRKLIENFPMTCTMTELHGNEKYYYLPMSLPTQSETPSEINKGEIMLFGSDCLVVFYDTFPNSYSYTKLGYIEDTTGLEKSVGTGSVDVTFEISK